MKNTIKILGTVMCAFVLDCAWGMDSGEFSWQECIKRYHKCLYQGDKHGTGSSKYKDALKNLLNYLENDSDTEIKQYEEDIRNRIKYSPSEQALQEVNNRIEGLISRIGGLITGKNPRKNVVRFGTTTSNDKKECINLVNKAFILQKIATELKSLIEKQSVQSYKDQINQEISGKELTEALLYLRHKKIEIEQEIEKNRGNLQLNEDQYTEITALQERLSALNEVMSAISSQWQDQIQAAYEKEVEQTISTMAPEEANSWWTGQWNDCLKYCKEIDQIMNYGGISARESSRLKNEIPDNEWLADIEYRTKRVVLQHKKRKILRELVKSFV